MGQTIQAAAKRPDQAIRSMANTDLMARIERNRHIVKQIASAILFCGKQGIALRGRVENIKDNTKGTCWPC